MMIITERTWLMAGVALLLSSCGDPSALTEDRISEIISEKVRLNPCIPFYGDGPIFATAYVNGQKMEMRDFLQSNEPFPVTVPIGGFDNFVASRFQEFEAAGLLTSKLEREESGMMGGPVQYRQYDLTPLGSTLYQVGARKYGDIATLKNPLFCAGKGQVAEVVNFVIPAEGANTTRVTFRWNTVDAGGNPISALPDQPWAAIGSYKSDRLPLEGEGNAMLTLTNNGWEMMQ